MRSAGLAAAALLYVAASIMTALAGGIIAELHCYEQECAGGDWTEARDGWQWDVIVSLALGSGLVGLVTTAVALSTRRAVYARVGFCLHVGLVFLTGALLFSAHDIGDNLFVLGLLLVAGSGLLFLYANESRQARGMRRA